MNLNSDFQKRVVVGSIGIHSIRFSDAFRIAVHALEGKTGRGLVVATPNPEMIVEANKNLAFREALNKADLVLPDGIGLKIIGKIIGYAIPERISGIDFVEYIFKNISADTISVFILGGMSGVAKTAADNLQKTFPSHKFAAASFAPHIQANGSFQDKEEENTVFQEIADFSPMIVLVGFGAPKQELWIQKYKQHFPAVKIFIGIGGALDIWAGNKKRAPSLLRKFGLEWLWRLAVEPKRIGRIMNAVFIFPTTALISRVKRF